MHQSSQHVTVEDLAEEYLSRRRNGERPTIAEYIERHPDLAEEIQACFPALQMVEDCKPETDSVDRRSDLFEREPRLTQFGDFRIVREAGRGGMGIVYEAEQVSLGRRVALKVLPQHLLAGEKQRKRFEREARAAARLHHTNIVPVFGVGEQEGLHYYVMQFIHGLGLDEVIVELKRLRQESVAGQATTQPKSPASPVEEGQPAASPEATPVSAVAVAHSLLSGHFRQTVLFDDASSDAEGNPVSRPLNSPPPTLPGDTAVGQLSDTAPHSFALPGQSTSEHGTSRKVYWESVARMGVQTAQALQYAHDQGVIHRDIKPGNLLLDTQGTVWVTDFGLAKATDQQDLTHTGDVLGTLRYMAPEQFEGTSDARSDIYALGLTLYELLALQPAFDQKDRRQLIKQVTEGTPTRLRSLDPHIPRDLETIVHKAIDRDPSHRYQTAGEMAADLQRYLGDEPIKARWVSPVTRLARWCKRNSAIASLTSTIALLLITAAIGSSLAAVNFQTLADDKSALAGDLADALSAAEHNYDLVKGKEQIAQQNLALANSERVRAEGNLQLAIEALDTVFLDFISDRRVKYAITGEAESPELTASEREFLDAGVAFYEKLIHSNEDSDEALFASGSARVRTGMLQSTRGYLTEARRHFDLAIQSLELLTSRSPRNAGFHRELARAYFNWAVNSDRPKREQESFTHAVDSYTESLQIDNQSADVYSERAAALRWVNRHKEALDDDTRAQELDPEDPSRLASLAWRILWIGNQAPELYDLPRALKCAQDAVALDPDHSRHRAILAQCLLHQGSPDEALAEIDKSVELDPNSVFARIQRIDVNRDRGDFEAALVDANWAVELEPTPYAYRMRASVFRDLKRYDEALADFERVDEEEVRGDFYYWIKRGEIHSLRGEHEKAIEYFSRGFELTPRGYPSLRKRRAVAYFSIGQYSEALADLRTALKLKPKDLSTLVWGGTNNIAACPDEAYKEGRLDLADQAIAHPDTDKVLAHRYRAELRAAMRRPEAMDDYSWLIEKQPDQPVWLLRRGLLRRDSGDEAGSQADFEAANVLAKSLNVGALGWRDEYELALLSLSNDQSMAYREACRRMLTAGEETTDHIEANFIAWTAALAPDAVEEFDAPLALTNKALESAADNQQYINTLGAILYRAGQHEDALSRLTELADQLDDPDPKANSSPAYCWYFLAMTHHALGHTGEAQTWLTKANDWTKQVLTDEENPPVWNRRLTLELLRDEATALIGEADQTSDPQRHDEKTAPPPPPLPQAAAPPEDKPTE